jgi:hypothetical protein
MSNNNNIGSYLYLQNSTLYLDKSSNVQNLDDGTSLHALVPLIGKQYNVYMLSSSTNSGQSAVGATTATLDVDTAKTVSKKFGETPSTNVSPNKANTTYCTTNYTFHGYIANNAVPKYYECTDSGSNKAKIYISTGKESMFEPSVADRHICIGYEHTPCEAGYSCNSCKRTACSAGTHQPLTAQSSCINCGAGNATKGSTTTCTACDAGTYSNGTANASCTACDVGKYQNETGKTSCKTCDANTYQDTPGQTSCKSCNTQTSSKYPSSAGGSDSISDCYLTLSDGQYVPTVSGGAQSCPAGSYCKKSGTTVYHSAPGSPTTAAVSGLCATGKYSLEGSSSCDPCGAGTYSPGGASSCQPCPIGTYQDTAEQSSCISCKDGKTNTTNTPTQSIFTTDATGQTERTACCFKNSITLKDSIGSSTLKPLKVCWKEQQ